MGRCELAACSFQLEAERGKQFGEFCEAQLSGASVFERIERSPTDARLARERGLAKLELLTVLGDTETYGDQVKHACLVY